MGLLIQKSIANSGSWSFENLRQQVSYRRANA
jgi:hypothetical protein